MPSFRFYRTDTGTEAVFELHRSIVNALPEGVLVRKSKLDGSKIEWQLIGEILGTGSPIQHPSTYPMWSDAMGINPDQIPDAMAADRAAGLSGIEYHPDTGAVRFADRTMRRKYCNHHYVFDRNGGYSDPQHVKTPQPEE